VTTCPCCRQQVDRVDPKDIADHVDASPAERRVLDYLVQSFGHRVPTVSLTEHLYADNPDGGPLTADRIVRHHTWRLRERLKPYGLTIRGRGGRTLGGGTTELRWI
jgi:DNA-binding response OmpR family regulator